MERRDRFAWGTLLGVCLLALGGFSGPAGAADFVGGTGTWDDTTIDLRRFRFKTWEDGLGNLAGPDSEHTGSGGPSDGIPPGYRPVDRHGRVSPDQVTFLRLHEHVAWRVVVAPDGSYIVSAGHDGRIVVCYLDKAMTKSIGPFDEGEARLRALDISRDSRYIAASGECTSSVLVVDMANDQQERIYSPRGAIIEALRFSSDSSRLLIVTGEPELVTLDRRTQQFSKPAPIRGELFRSLISSGGTSVVATVADAYPLTHDNCHLVFLNARGEEQASFALDKQYDLLQSALVFRATDELMLFAATGGAKRWRLDSEWRLAEKLESPVGPFSSGVVSGHKGHVWLAGWDGVLVEVDVKSGNTVREIALDVGAVVDEVGLRMKMVPAITDIALVPGRDLLAAALRDGRVALIRTGK